MVVRLSRTFDLYAGCSDKSRKSGPFWPKRGGKQLKAKRYIYWVLERTHGHFGRFQRFFGCALDVGVQDRN